MFAMKLDNGTTFTSHLTPLCFVCRFRADSLEEIVGLDMSYHGGVHAEFEDVSPAQMKAYKARKSGRRRRYFRDEDESENADGDEDDEEDNDDASWTDMTVASTPDSSLKPESAPRKQVSRRRQDLEGGDNSSQFGQSTYSLGEESEFTGRS